MKNKAIKLQNYRKADIAVNSTGSTMHKPNNVCTAQWDYWHQHKVTYDSIMTRSGKRTRSSTTTNDG